MNQKNNYFSESTFLLHQEGPETPQYFCSNPFHGACTDLDIMKFHHFNHQETATIMLPEFLAGRILGKSGETHQKIKKDTGSKLHFMEIEVSFPKGYWI